VKLYSHGDLSEVVIIAEIFVGGADVSIGKTTYHVPIAVKFISKFDLNVV
jgi:hypothetical protein